MVLDLARPQDTLRLGRCLGKILRAGDMVGLWGGLGVGKTTLARGVITMYHPEFFVPSPTFGLVHTYSWGETELWHVDLYRLEGATPDLGLEEAEGILLVEWAERMERTEENMEFWKERLDIHLKERDGARQAQLEGHGERGQELAKKIMRAWVS